MQKQKGLSKSTAWYTLGNLFIRSINFVLLPLYSHILSTEDFGNYALLMSLYVLVSVFFLGGMQASLSKYYLEVDSTSEQKKIFSTIFNVVIVNGVIVYIIAFIFSKEISSVVLNSTSYSELVKLTFAVLFFDVLAYFILHLLKTKQLPQKVVVYSAVSAIINLLLNIYLVYYLKLGVEGIFYSQLCSSVILFAIMIPILKEEYSPFLIHKKLLRKIFSFALPLFAAGIFSSAVDVIDRFILEHFLGKSVVGIYSFSYRIAMIMNVFVISFRTAWTPHSLNLFNSKKHYYSFGAILNKLLAISGIILLSVSFFSDELFKINIFGINLFNRQYEAGIIILPFVLLGYLFNGISSFYSVYPYAAGKSYHLLISDILAFAVNLLLNFLLIPKYGMLGAAVATTLGFLFASFYLFRISSKAVKFQYNFSPLTVVITSTIIFLVLGLYSKNLVAEIVYLFLYLIVVNFGAKIKLTEILKFAE